MSVCFKPLSLLAALSLLAGCASSGGGDRSAAAEAVEPPTSGIQTRAIRAAPEAREAQNDSRPLSELNTPEAIAAREAASAGSPPMPQASAAPVMRPAPPITAPPGVAPAATAAASPAHQKIDSLQKGAKVRVRAGAGLHARPNAASDSTPAPAGIEMELGAQIYNAGGYWWYVTGGKDSGWLLQTDILR